MNAAISKTTSPPTLSLGVGSGVGGGGVNITTLGGNDANSNIIGNVASTNVGMIGGSTTVIGGAGVTNIIPRTVSDKAKQAEREVLMERIRGKMQQQKSFPDLSKAMRMTMLEKRYALDAVEKSNLQKSLDRLQQHIKVKTRPGLIERLESLSRQLGMKFMEDSSGLFISTDMFYLEIILEANGKLTDVKVHHECKPLEQTSCKELVDCLNNNDFADFTSQLEGLSAIYQLNAEPKVKTKAFVALQAMETDLLKLYQNQNFVSKDTLQSVAESTVGIVLQRRGGHAMRLTYFVSPYDFVNLDSQKLEDPGKDGINSKQLGLSVSVNLEASSANKLQIAPLVSFAKDPVTGVESGLPIYAAMTQSNSMLLPATFVLRLNKPLPVCCSALQKLLEPNSAAAQHSQRTNDSVSNVTIINLIVQTAIDQQSKGSPQKGLIVNLPDTTHCYFFTEHKDMKATLLTSVPFTEPSQVPKIIEFLKKQALFYTLIASCVRPQSKMGYDIDSTVILEVNSISFEQIAVSLQHPYEDSLATVEFDLRSGRGTIRCSIYSLYTDYTEAARKMSVVVQKSLSIPVTIRALLRYWDREHLDLFQRGIGSGNGGGGLIAAQGVYGLPMSTMSINDLPSEPGPAGSAAMSRQPFPTGNGGGTGIAAAGGNNGNGASTSAAAVAGYLKYKQDVSGNILSGANNSGSSTPLKTEDYMDTTPLTVSNQTPMAGVVASSTSITAGILSSMAATLTMSTPAVATSMSTAPTNAVQSPSPSISPAPLSHLLTPPPTMSAFSKASEIEIADKYKNIWKDKTANLKSGQLSITPIASIETKSGIPVSVATTAITQQATTLDVKRSGGIEIIPLTSGNSQVTNQSQAAMPSSLATTAEAMAVAATTALSPTATGQSAITITPINAAVAAATIANKDKLQQSSTLLQQSPSITCSPTTAASVTPPPIVTAVTGLTAVLGVSASVSQPTLTTATVSLPVGSKRSASSDADATLSSSSNSSTSSNSSVTAAPPKEKKRKKKRDDSPMGPPEKVYSRQNSPAAGGDGATNSVSAVATTVARKFSSPSSSPKGASGASGGNNCGVVGLPASGVLLGSATSGIVGVSSTASSGGAATISTRPSPKHSPVYSSPKHTNTASNSPKSPFGTHSPKHGSAGKPSMSTLKSASSGSATSANASSAAMKVRDKEKSPAISPSSSMSGIITTTTVVSSSGLSAAAAIVSKSTHLGMSNVTSTGASGGGSSSGITSSAGIGIMPHQLKTAATLNQLLSSYASNSSGGNSPSGMQPSSTISTVPTSDMTSVTVAAMRKSGVPPPPPPPPTAIVAGGNGGSNAGNGASSGASSIGASGAGAAVSLMTSNSTPQQQLQLQQPQQPLQLSQPLIHQQQQQQHHQQQHLVQQQQQSQLQLPLQQLQPLQHGSNELMMPPASASLLTSSFKSSQNTGIGGVGIMTVTASNNNSSSINDDKAELALISSSGNNSSNNSNSNINNSNNNAEYMVKTSQEGLKLTINKTSLSGSGKIASIASTQPTSLTSISTSLTPPSAKKHTGLKPGVHSGPASKKGRTSPSPPPPPPPPPPPTTPSSVSSSTTSAVLAALAASSASALSLTTTSSCSVSLSPITSGFPRLAPSNESIMRLVQYAAAATTTTMGTSSPPTPPPPPPPPPPPLPPTPPPPSHSTSLSSSVDSLLASSAGFGIKSLNTKFQIPKLTQRSTGSSGGSVGLVSSNAITATTTIPMTTSQATQPMNVASSLATGMTNTNSNFSCDIKRISPPALAALPAPAALLALTQQQQQQQQQQQSQKRSPTHGFMRSPPPSYQAAMAAAVAAAAAAAAAESAGTLPSITTSLSSSSSTTTLATTTATATMTGTSQHQQQLPLSTLNDDAGTSAAATLAASICGLSSGHIESGNGNTNKTGNGNGKATK